MHKGRPSKRRPVWTTARRIVQYLALAGFLALFVMARRGGWPAALVDLPLRLDPLLALLHLLSSRALLAASLLAMLTVALTLLLGRVWCGWLCPLGTTLDLLSPRRPDRRTPGIAAGWRQVKYGVLFFLLLAALLGNLTLVVLDPLTLLLRALTTGIWPALDQGVTALERALYRLPAARGAVSRLDGVMRPAVFPVQSLAYRYGLLFVMLLAGVVALNWLAPRFWCRYLCPLGGLLGLLSKVALFRRRVDDRCIDCGRCAGLCPTATVDAAQGYASDAGECTICLECLDACPARAISLVAQRPPEHWNDYDPDRRLALRTLGTAALWAGLLRSGLLARRLHPYSIRPPGAQDQVFLVRCIRCGACMRACPTGAIQPALAEAGVEGLWTPVLVLRVGYCDYSCNACGQVCPVGAIPPLSLEEKRQQVIGWAYIDRNRCIPWADERPCIVCEEMCPLPEKAIELEEVEVASPDGQMRMLQRPRVIRERCIGCGICEYQCPVTGEAAIRVQVPGTPFPF